MDLEGSVTIVTGGGRGIGQAVARSLAGEGAQVIVCSRTETELARTATAIGAIGGSCEPISADVSRPLEVKRLIREVQARHARVDVLVHCAGYTAPAALLEETSIEDYRRTIETNAGALFYLSRELLPIMRTQESGLIVAMSSGCGLRGHPRLTAYSMSKFAVQGLVQALAAELDDSLVRCVAINPGGVDTKMLEDLFGQEEARKNQSPERVADVVKRVVSGELSVPSGGGVTVRHGKARVYER